MESRYAICSTGSSFTVENRRTGERLGSFKTWAAATREQKRLSSELRDRLVEAETIGDGVGSKT